MVYPSQSQGNLFDVAVDYGTRGSLPPRDRLSEVMGKEIIGRRWRGCAIAFKDIR